MLTGPELITAEKYREWILELIAQRKVSLHADPTSCRKQVIYDWLGRDSAMEELSKEVTKGVPAFPWGLYHSTKYLVGYSNFFGEALTLGFEIPTSILCWWCSVVDDLFQLDAGLNHWTWLHWMMKRSGPAVYKLKAREVIAQDRNFAINLVTFDNVTKAVTYAKKMTDDGWDWPRLERAVERQLRLDRRNRLLKLLDVEDLVIVVDGKVVQP